MLAQLDGIDGVAESRVDWTGRFFLLKLAPGRKPEEVTVRVSAVLKQAARLDATREAEQSAAYRRGEPWMRAGETLKMSEHEAIVLGERFATKAAGTAGLDAEQTKLLVEILKEELAALFTRLQGTDWQLQKKLRHEWPDLIARTLERSLKFVTEEQAGKIRESLQSAFGQRK